MPAQAMLLEGGQRLHLQHGPIDLIIGAEGDRAAAYRAATTRFESVLDKLVTELPALRQQLTDQTPVPQGSVAQRMDRAARPYASTHFVTRMAAVAGAVADTVLQAMVQDADVERAYVNNGGDIAVHLTPGQHFVMGMAHVDGSALGRITLRYEDPIRGIATSGRQGRSQSMGIADSVTVLAPTAAQADVAATLIANAVDLPDHPAVVRAPANSIVDDSDLRDRLVVTHCGVLNLADCTRALKAGLRLAKSLEQRGLIHSAALFLQGDVRITDATPFALNQRTQNYG